MILWPHCNCDYEAVIVFITIGRAKEIHIAHQLRCLFAVKPGFDYNYLCTCSRLT